jgi:hypothetical protein
MCVPSVFIRDDGKGFVVRKGGIDWEINCGEDGVWQAYGPVFNINSGFTAPDEWGGSGGTYGGYGDTIMEAVDSALAKVKDRE